MLCRSRDKLEKLLHNTPTASHSQRSSSMAVMKEPLGGHQDISEEPIGEKKKETFL